MVTSAKAAGKAPENARAHSALVDQSFTQKVEPRAIQGSPELAALSRFAQFHSDDAIGQPPYVEID
jgi:hypothetical protein